MSIQANSPAISRLAKQGRASGARYLFRGLLALPALSWGQVLMVADGPGNTYELIQGKGYGLETPDCGHNVRHIEETLDNVLGKNVFVFTIHKDLDDDRCGATDRQRLEIKTGAGNPANMTGEHGQTHTYRWKFKLDAAFQPSPNFCHIHQIKAQGGSDEGAPIITITPRAGNPEIMEVIHVRSGGGSSRLVSANLSLFKGVWVEAYEKVVYSDNGSIDLTLRNVATGAVLLTARNTNLDMWRDGANLNRPKYGIYRSLNSPSYLRDESVRFADFCLGEGSVDCPATVPIRLRPLSPSRLADLSSARWFDLRGRIFALSPKSAPAIAIHP
jgi:hypothetical protein